MVTHIKRQAPEPSVSLRTAHQHPIIATFSLKVQMSSRVPAFELACPTGRSSSVSFRHKRPFPFLQVSPLPEPPSMPPSRRPAFFPWWHFAISQIILFIGFHGYAPPPPTTHPSCQLKRARALPVFSPAFRSVPGIQSVLNTFSLVFQ